jgi:hypothetical protein
MGSAEGGVPVDDLRSEIRGLADKRMRGDLGEKAFRKRALELSVALARAEARAVVGDEAIVAEHHVVHSHFRLTESLMREPEQTTVSYFATERRLVRVRGTLVTGRAQANDDGASTAVDTAAYERIKAIERRVEWRWGEVGMGLAIALVALLFRGTLAITGPVLVLLGLAGALHGLLMPTRWIEIEVESGESPFTVHGVWRRSGRRMLAAVRRSLQARDARA